MSAMRLPASAQIPHVITRPRPDGCDGVLVRCPYCGREHAHGLGAGHRLPHCRWNTPGRSRGYRLDPQPGAP